MRAGRSPGPHAGHSSTCARRGQAAVLTLALALATAGCTSPAPADPPVGSTAASTTAPSGAALTTFSYGPRPAQSADLLLPAGLVTRTDELRTPSAAPEAGGPEAAGTPGQTVDVVVLVHGGYWGAGYDRTLETAVAQDLTDDGIVVWNLDYRGVGAADPADEGGWPGTFEDVAAGLDLLPEALASVGLAPDRVAVVGHSAGGTMALWLAARHTLPDGAPGAAPAVRPDLVVTQAGVNDLRAAASERGSRVPVESLMGGAPSQVPDDRYDLASPTARLPLGVPTLVTTGDQDTVVVPTISTGFAEAARAAGDDVTLTVVPGEGHDVHLDPSSASWAGVRAWLAGGGIEPAALPR